VFVDHDQLEMPDNELPTSPGPATASKGKQKIQHVPSLKEYFTDLDFLLGVCSDGPAKSFAFRRLKYLASKWSLYCLLNEYQELADMKV
jgi:AMP deaminase